VWWTSVGVIHTTAIDFATKGLALPTKLQIFNTIKETIKLKHITRVKETK